MRNANQGDRDSWPRHGSFLAKRLILQLIGFLFDTVSTSLRNDLKQPLNDIYFKKVQLQHILFLLTKTQLPTNKGSFLHLSTIACGL